MEAIDSDELKGNPFFCSSAREQCTCQLNLNRVIGCCYLSWWIRYFFSVDVISAETAMLLTIRHKKCSLQTENGRKRPFGISAF